MKTSELLAAALIVLVASAGAGMSGCSSVVGKVKVKSAEGEVEVSKDGVKVKSGGGTVVVEKGDQHKKYTHDRNIDMEKFGVPVYPGAEVVVGGTVESPGGKARAIHGATLKTTDPVGKVVEFYRKKLKGAKTVDMLDTQGSVVFILVGKDASKSVIVQKTGESGGATQITISVGPGVR